jgi:hypothetical protein
LAGSTELPRLQPDVVLWQRPSITTFRGTVLGAVDVTSYIPTQSARVTIRDGQPVVIPRDQWRSMRMEDQFDVILHLGPPSTITFARVSRSICADTDYMAMRTRRMTLFGMRMKLTN